MRTAPPLCYYKRIRYKLTSSSHNLGCGSNNINTEVVTTRYCSVQNVLLIMGLYCFNMGLLLLNMGLLLSCYGLAIVKLWAYMGLGYL